MEKEINRIWSDTLAIIQNEFTEVTFATMIKVLTPVNISESEFFLMAPRAFFKETIEKRYIPMLTEGVKAVTGVDYTIHIMSREAELNKEDKLPRENTHISHLVQKYTFKSFVKAKSNELAYATAVAIAQNPGTTAYNPLFMYGGVGLGKTHLMHSIGNYIKEMSPETKVLYCSTETFVNELIWGIQHNKNDEFRNKYRATDVLLLDDIQFISKKERTQEELFHTFNVLRDANKQIVISSDKPPKEIDTLESRLISRFGQGIIVDLKLPDLETRIAILEKKAQADGIVLPKDVKLFIADNFYSNIRDLEGALNKVIAYSKLADMELTYDMARNALADLLEEDKFVIDIPHIQLMTARYFNISPESLKSKTRKKEITYARHIAMYLCRKMLDEPLTEIGNFFGGRDHSSVIHGCEKIADNAEIDEQLKDTLIQIENLITGGQCE